LSLLAASFVLGLLLDEVVFPVFAAAFGALLLSRQFRRLKDLLWCAASGGGGLLAARLFYQVVQHTSAIKAVSPPENRSFHALLDPDIWQALTIPLSDSVLHQDNQIALLGESAPMFAAATGAILACAHVWFWWRCLFIRRTDAREYPIVTYLAMAIMLFFYAFVLGIVLQRVLEFGFSYLHQSRYVIFYQLHLSALSLLIYRECLPMGSGNQSRQLARTVAVVCILAFAVLQFRLSTLAWEHSKYVSRYVESAALTLGRLAVQPDLEIECVDTLNICKYPVEKRRAIMNMLVRYRLNLFSPEFQAFHRLYPFGQGAEAQVLEDIPEEGVSP
jgi:hypothetical protein